MTTPEKNGRNGYHPPEPKEPLFILEDFWDSNLLGMIPCYGRRRSCALYPGDEIRTFGMTKRRSVGCGDCDLFQSRLLLNERLAEQAAREEKRRKALWWKEQHGYVAQSEEELLRMLDAERDREDDE